MLCSTPKAGSADQQLLLSPRPRAGRERQSHVHERPQKHTGATKHKLEKATGRGDVRVRPGTNKSVCEGQR